MSTRACLAPLGLHKLTERGSMDKNSSQEVSLHSMFNAIFILPFCNRISARRSEN
jgi:hypothetical protein